MGQFQLKTKNGYDFFEVASAFQKAIRRCDEKQAMFWAVELYEDGKHAYAWKRMIIMASEDVGLGDPYVITIIMALKQSFDHLFSLKEKGKPEKLPFTQAVLQLAKCKKSRYVDIAISVYWDANKSLRAEMPDYVFDMHTRKGKAMNRGLQHFYEVAAHINNANKMHNEDEMEKIARKADEASYYAGSGIGQENISCTKKEADQNAQGKLDFID